MRIHQSSARGEQFSPSQGGRPAVRGGSNWVQSQDSCVTTTAARKGGCCENSMICAQQRVRSRRRSADDTVSGRGNRFRRSCVYMTYNETRRMAIPHQAGRSLGASACFSRSRRPTTPNRAVREGMVIRRIRHGIARATEGLRRLWLPLVSGPNSRECVLQNV